MSASTTVADVMTRFPTTVRLGARVRHAAELVAAAEIGQLMVLDGADRFVGVLSEGDLLRALLPSGEELRAAGGTVTAGFGVFRAKASGAADAPIDPLVVRDAVTITPDADVAAAAVAMTDRRLRRLPVVADGRLVGTVSRIDLCRAVLARASTVGATTGATAGAATDTASATPAPIPAPAAPAPPAPAPATPAPATPAPATPAPATPTPAAPTPAAPAPAAPTPAASAPSVPSAQDAAARLAAARERIAARSGARRNGTDGG